MSDEDANRAARRSFGNLGSIKDRAYEVRGGGFVETLLQDLRYGVRLLLKHPGFTLVAVATLAIGIGANTAIFSIGNAVLLRPFPFPQPDRIVMVSEGAGGNVSYPNFADWKDDRNLFASTSAVRGDESYDLTGVGEPERLQARLVSAGFLATLKVYPVLGHDFTPDDDRPGASPKVLLSHVFWNCRFNADPAQQSKLHGGWRTATRFSIRSRGRCHHSDWSLGGSIQSAWCGPGNHRGRSSIAEGNGEAVTGSARCDLCPTGTRIPEQQYRPPCLSDADARVFRRQCARASIHPVRISWPGTPDRVCECCESASCSRVYAQTRDFGSRCAGCKSVAYYSRVADRQSSPCADWSCSRSASRSLGNGFHRKRIAGEYSSPG